MKSLYSEREKKTCGESYMSLFVCDNVFPLKTRNCDDVMACDDDARQGRLS